MTRQRGLHILQYNDAGTDTLNTLADSLGTLEPHDEAVVLGDFNLHDPL